MRSPKTYFVYIMTNRSKTLYTGVTNNLIRRVREHKMGTGSHFAAKYRIDRLVYFERFEDIHNAIEREKRIKGWLRVKEDSVDRFRQPGVEGFEPRVVRATSASTGCICSVSWEENLVILSGGFGHEGSCNWPQSA